MDHLVGQESLLEHQPPHGEILLFSYSTMLFLFKCNIDIKFIGSDKADKALIYYIMDYITKASLPMYLSL